MMRVRMGAAIVVALLGVVLASSAAAGPRDAARPVMAPGYAVGHMAVFHEPSRGTVPKAILRALFHFFDTGSRPLRPPSQARVLLHDRVTGWNIYAVASKRGAVCEFAAHDADLRGGGCMTGFPADSFVAPGFGKDGPDTPWTMTALAANRVVAIRVTAGGRTWLARRGWNAFDWQAPDNHTRPTSLSVEWSDGTRHVVEVPSLGR